METFTIKIENDSGDRYQNIVCFDGDDLYIPASVAGMSDGEAALCCGYDGAKFVTFGEKILVPEKWARKENPGLRDVIDAFARCVRETRESLQKEKPISDSE